MIDGSAAPRRHFLRLWVAGKPAGQGSLRPIRDRRGNTRIVHDNQEELLRWRGFVWADARNAWAGRAPLAEPLRIELTFLLPSGRFRRYYPAGLDAAGLAMHWALVKKQDDLDKLIRAILDALTMAKVWEDDAFVVEVVSRKIFDSVPDHRPGVQIDLSPAVFDPLTLPTRPR